MPPHWNGPNPVPHTNPTPPSNPPPSNPPPTSAPPPSTNPSTTTSGTQGKLSGGATSSSDNSNTSATNAQTSQNNNNDPNTGLPYNYQPPGPRVGYPDGNPKGPSNTNQPPPTTVNNSTPQQNAPSATPQAAPPPGGPVNLPGNSGSNSGQTGTAPGPSGGNESSTTFLNDASSSIATPILPRSIPHELIQDDVGATWSDIKAFLAKPFTNSTLRGQFSSTDTTATFVNSQFWFFDPLTIGATVENVLATAKLKGIWSMRATIRVRIVVNATVFQQGRYLFAFLPSGGCDFEYTGNPFYCNNQTPWFTSLYYDKCKITQLPHVEIDINQQTECILDVPYESCTTHWPVGQSGFANTIGNPGKFGIFPYAALSTGTGSATTCNYQIYISYHDVEFSTSAVPQMAVQDDERSAPISSIAHHVSHISGILGAAVPSISSITTPVQWASDLIAGIATMFGYSAPLNLAPPSKSSLTWFPNALNPDATDNSAPLSLFSRNSVEAMSGVGGTDIDETSFEFLKQIPAWIGTLSFTTSSNVGDNLLWLPLAPDNFIANSSYFGGSAYTYATVSGAGAAAGNYTGTTTVQTSPPFVYMSRFFNRWRGGFKFKIKFVKTSFHSGRLAFVFQPAALHTNSASAPSYDNLIYAHRDIIDIRECSEFIVSVPYTSLTPYKELWGANADISGFFGIYVVNPVVAPNTVSSTINVIVEAMAESDFEVQVPRQSTRYPGVSLIARTQMDVEGLLTNEKFVGETIGAPHTVSPAKFCIGEKANSLYQLAKSAYPIVPGTSSTFANKYLTIDPASVGIDVLQTTTAVMRNDYTPTFTANMESPPDNYGRILPMYAMSRGGFRTKVFQNTSGTNVNAVITSGSINSTVSANVGTYTGLTGSNSQNYTNLAVAQNQAFTGGAEVQTPMYGKSFARATPMMLYNSNASTAAYNFLPKANYNDGLGSGVSVIAGTPAGNFTNVSYMRAAADDFQLFRFVGAPLVFNYT